MNNLQIVWFKRDLRVHDHAALVAAAARGPVLPLFIVEPELWRQPDYAGRHWAFAAECLTELREGLAALGQPLIVRVGEAISVLVTLLDSFPVQALWSHEETGNGWTFRRDREVAAFLRSRAVPWNELPQNGVVRRLADRDQWSRIWESRMRAPLTAPVPLPRLDGIAPGPIPTSADLKLQPDPCPERQHGGRRHGEAILDDFLMRRGREYRRAMSSPNTAFDGCSRLSAHLAWGSISMRELVQGTRLRRDRIRASPAGEGRGWLGALSAFEGRLHWHCHFMQKLESEPELEFSNLHRACDGLRENEFDPERLAAWSNGETGFPLVDACMRALKTGGWINFRMRAMLVSFSSYQLWLHWREPALVLARLFTDYEPGIHYSQIQMQSGTTGINTLRIYNPVKQSQDQDPEGRFIRRWIPELDHVPTEWIHTPWLMPADQQRQSRCVIGSQYPAPIVDHLAAAREARGRIQAARRSPEARDEGRQILKTHGSRRRTPRRGDQSSGGQSPAAQSDRQRP